VRVAKDNAPHLVLGRCRDRLCPLCSALRGRECTDRVTKLVQRMNAPRFVTLTVKNDAAPLASQVDFLFTCFRKLRAHAWWKKKVTGGCYSLEVTYNAREATWHPHLHLIVDGEFLPQKELASIWKQITGGSPIVWVEKVNDAARSAKYIAAYVNTPPDVHTWPPRTIVHYAEAMHGRRVLGCFGSMHAANVDASRAREAPEQTTFVCTVRELVQRACEGNASAERACSLLIRMGGLWAAVAQPFLNFDASMQRELSEAEWREFGRLIKEAFAEETKVPDDPPDDAVACGPLLFDVSPLHD